jgi:hypothetical protein
MISRALILAAASAAALAACATTNEAAAPAAAAPTSAPAAPVESAHDRLYRLFQESDEANLRRNPISAMFRGDFRYADHRRRSARTRNMAPAARRP